MESNHQPAYHHRLLPAFAPMLLVSIEYVDPGKWAATVEGGAQFGFDLMAFMLLFNFAAILCHYISVKIAVVTGRDLAENCSNEYDMWTCMFLGVQTELSVIMLDLNLILGMAHVLNLLFGWDLFTCVFLTAAGAVFHLLLAVLLDNGKAKIVGLFVAGFVLLSFVLGMVVSQPEIPLSMNLIITRLSGESAFALMSLLGATLMPHNFYLHSAVAQWHGGSENSSKDALCHNHIFAIMCIFSVIYMVNNMLMNTAVNEFYSTGLVLLNLQDALSPMEQFLRSPVALLAFLLVLFLSNQTTALTWSLGGEVVVHDFLKLDIPGWLHFATIRVIAVLPALYCVWSSGAEGLYQLLIFTQVVVALQLPSSVIPLFRIATSRSIMGVHKISQFVEFLALIIFIGMLGLNIVFVVEMIFGSSDWVGNLRWNVGNGISISYLVLLITACASFSLMLWLAATPLKSASVQLDAQVWNWDTPGTIPNPPGRSEELDFTETKYHPDASLQVKEASALGSALDSSDISVANVHPDLPETITEPDQELHMTTVEENHSLPSSSPTYLAKESSSALDSEAESKVVNVISDVTLVDTKTVKMETSVPAENTVEVEGDKNAQRDDDEGDTWENDEPSKVVSVSALSSVSDGPPSSRSLSGKSDEGGNNIGSLSRLAGLGRAARRQLAQILDEFWGQLYDFHGQATQEAEAKKLDVLLGVDSRPSGSLQKVDVFRKEYSDYLVPFESEASDGLMNAGLYDSPNQPRVGLQSTSSSLRANPSQLLNAYMQNPSHTLLESGERRYSSVRNLPSSEALDYQPATVHGYQVASYLSRAAKDRNSDSFNGQMELSSLKSSSIGNTNYRDSPAFALGLKLRNGIGPSQPPGFQNTALSGNNLLQPERSYYDFTSSGPADNVVSAVNTKKYHSLPDISGCAVPRKNVYAADKSAPWDNSVGYGSSASLYSNSGSRSRAPLAFDELSPSKVYTNALSSQLSSGFDTRSLWSRQPFEQFGVADKINNVAKQGVGNRPCSIAQEATSVEDLEVKLLLSFRQCIVRLLKLEGSNWLFNQNDGADEDLIDRVAAREKFVYEVETRDMGEVHHFSSDRKLGSAMKNNDTDSSAFWWVSTVPNCGEGCVWRSDLIISFGVWCIHRILDLSLMESRPELWGKYTYVLNRLQGIIDPAFSKPRSPTSPCFCLQVPASHQQKSSPSLSNGMLPPTAKSGRGKMTTAGMLLDLIKDVELAISQRKGRAGTAAGDVAFPRGKENLLSVLKRYKRRLSNKPVGTQEGTCLRKVPSSAPYNS